MLDKKAQKSLLDNAAAVNQAILDVYQANVTEYNDKLKSFTDKSGVTDENAKALYKETFGKEAQQSLKVQTLLDLPVMKKEAVNKVIKIMDDRKKEDAVVEEKLEIAKVESTVSNTSRSSQTLKDLIGGDYFKNGDEKVYKDINSTTNPIVAFSLPVKSDTTDEDYTFICMEFNFKNNTRSMLSFTAVDAYANFQYEPFTMAEKDNAEYKGVFAKKEKDEYFMAWSAAVKVTTPAPPKGIAKIFNFKHAEPTLSYLPYEKTGTRKPAAITQVVLSSGNTELYLPILRGGKLFYLHVDSKDDVDVKEIDGDIAPTGGAQNLEIDGHETQIENTNPDFYNWWLAKDYILNVPKPTPASVKRGNDKLIDEWDELTKEHGANDVDYANLPVGALTYGSTVSSLPTTFKGVYIVLDPSTKYLRLKMNETIADGITGVVMKTTKLGGDIRVMDSTKAKEYLQIKNNLEQFNDLIASNEILAKKFAPIITSEIQSKATSIAVSSL